MFMFKEQLFDLLLICWYLLSVYQCVYFVFYSVWYRPVGVPWVCYSHQ